MVLRAISAPTNTLLSVKLLNLGNLTIHTIWIVIYITIHSIEIEYIDICICAVIYALNYLSLVLNTTANIQHQNPVVKCFDKYFYIDN